MALFRASAAPAGLTFIYFDATTAVKPMSNVSRLPQRGQTVTCFVPRPSTRESSLPQPEQRQSTSGRPDEYRGRYFPVPYQAAASVHVNDYPD